MLDLPSFFQDFYVARIYSNHQEQHMNENMKREKKYAGTWERSKIPLMRFLRLKPAASA